MFGIICLTWVGFKLSAPTWYFVLLIISGVVKLLNYGTEMYKKGRENK